MFNKKNLAYVLTSLEAIEKIFLYTKSFKDPEAFFWANDQLNFNATYNLLLVVGEETKKIETELKKEFPDIQWKQISGLRNHLAHDYRGTDPEILYEIVKSYLPPLKKVLVEMISRIDVDHDFLRKVISTDHYKNLKYLLKK
jgi:uncharacterized protein with HEPN domain